MSASPDDNHIEEIYRGIPVGLTITATRLDHFETLRSFCFPPKGAAIRLGSNPMLFPWQYSKRNWLDKGLGHFRSFVERHTANGVRLFFIDQPTGYADREVAHRLRELAESLGVSVILTAIAHRREPSGEKWLAALDDGAVVFCSTPTISLRGRSTSQLVPACEPVAIEGSAGGEGFSPSELCNEHVGTPVLLRNHLLCWPRGTARPIVLSGCVPSTSGHPGRRREGERLSVNITRTERRIR